MGVAAITRTTVTATLDQIEGGGVGVAPTGRAHWLSYPSTAKVVPPARKDCHRTVFRLERHTRPQNATITKNCVLVDYR